MNEGIEWQGIAMDQTDHMTGMAAWSPR